MTPISIPLLVLSASLLFPLPAACQPHHAGSTAGIDPYRYTARKDISGTHGVVVCAHPLAAQVGYDILRQGGNAVDAAIATQLALAVVYPGAGNLGGGGFMVLRTDKGKVVALDYRETAPAAASRDMYIDAATGKANTDLSQNGRLAAGVPGTVAGLFASMRYASLPFRTLIQPAIRLAAGGYCITQREADNLNANAAAIRKHNSALPPFYREAGWKAGDTLVQPDLARTLERIRDQGQKGFYEGETARLIVGEMQRGGGIITAADLKGYRAKERPAVTFGYKGYQVITMPPPSSGGILLAQMLKMLEGRHLEQYGYNSLRNVQLVTEVERRAYADRAEHLGDPDFYKVPQKGLLDPAYLKRRMQNYDSTLATPSSAITAGVIRESEQTTHISILDGRGNCVSLTTTLNGVYGSKTVVAGAGFFLNNEMDDFSVQPGVPNLYGAIGGKANAIAPGKRMLSSMTPAIVLKDGKPFMVVGTPGGTTIITSVLQSIINVVDYGMNAHDAVNGPKFHHQWQPDEVYVEPTFPADVRQRLAAMGYKIVERPAIGRTELILIRGRGYEAAADGRGDDAAAGW